MICYNCGANLTHNDFCTNCGADVARYKKIIGLSNLYYNEGLEKAVIRDLSGAIVCLRQCLKMNKNHVDARNLLGLIYFEMGEYVAALSEWVISKNLRPNKNIADDYIGIIQNNPASLDSIGQAVKKYNLALNYCYQGSLDLAVIQLKKVINLNPRFVQAHQLLALLFIQSEQWEDAKRELMVCKRIDINNTVTLRYLKEVRAVLDIDDNSGFGFKTRKKAAETVTYKLHNETIIEPVGRKDNKTLSTLINVFIGVAIGIAVAYFMILPARISSVRGSFDESLKVANEQLDAKTASIAELEQQLKTADSKNEKLSSQLELYIGEDGTMTAMDNLLNAVSVYINDPSDVTEVAQSLDEIPVDALDQASEEFLSVYQLLLSRVGGEVALEYYESGMKYYQSEQYESAIGDLSKAYSYDNTNADALYNLGNAYRKYGDEVNAVDTYQAVIDNFPGTETATRAQQYINELNGE
ncbi:MAG: tetratricopeptide repeat protein [Lachnospiraceae bacterium]|nr:tetratricopeptide repeat protein [Lachnospiraceae bacterium]